MKRNIFFILLLTSIFFTACVEDEIKDVNEETVERKTDVNTSAVHTVKKKSSSIEKMASDAAKATKNAAVILTKVAKEKAVETTVAAVELAKDVITDNDSGKVLYAKCSGCHGKEGKLQALGRSEVIAGQSAQEIEKKMTAYKEGSREVSGMGKLMMSQMVELNTDDIKAVSAYISTL